MITSSRPSFILPFLLLLAGALILPITTHAQVKAPSVPQPSGSTDIVGMNLQNPTSTSIPSGPVQFGQVFKEGDLGGNSGVALKVNGSTIPAQIDVKTRHADGSVKFGVVSAVAPTLSANTANPSMLMSAAKSGTPISLSSLSGLDMDVTIAIQGGGTFTYDLASIFARELAAGKVTYWRQGPIVTEGRIDIYVTSSLRLVVDLAKYSDGTYWADIMFNNDRAMTATGGTLRYAATISNDGRTVVSHPTLTHYQYQQWHQEVWSKPASAEINVQRDVPYIISTGAVANYDLTNGVDQSLINRMNEAVSSANWNKPFEANWIAKAMGMAGGRPDIGVHTLWNTAWIMTQHPISAKMGLGQANGAAAITWHYWDAANNTWLNTDHYPKLWIDGRGEPAGVPGDRNSGRPTQLPADGHGWGPDSSHQPSLNFVPYLFTGKRYLLDQLNAAASWNIMSSWPSGEEYGNARFHEKGIIVSSAFEIRGGAWGLRGVIQAAWANPDGSPEKTYFTKISNNNIEWLKSQMASRTTLQGDIHGYNLGYAYWNNQAMSPWQNDFLLSTLVQAYNFGFTNVKPYLEWSKNWYVGRFMNADNGFNPRDGVNHNIPNNPRQPTGEYKRLTSWRDMGAHGIAWDSNGFSGWTQSNGYFGQLGIMSMALLADTLGDENAKKAYAWLKTAQPSYTDAANMSKEPTFNIVPKQPIAPMAPTTVRVTLTSDRSLVVDGEQVTLTWSSQNARRCTGTSLDPDFVVNSTSGSIKVTPKKQSDYMVICTGAGGPLDFAGDLKRIRFSANPVSPDGSVLVPGGTSVSTPEGVWTFGTETNDLGTRTYLNGNPAGGGYGTGIYILNGGRAFLATKRDWWYYWENNDWRPHYGGDPRTPATPTAPTEPTTPTTPTTPTVPTDPTKFGEGSDILKVGLSGDLWGDLPGFNVLLDGKNIGSGRVAANEKLGQIEYINVHGDFSDGRSHTLVIQFYNDAWGGSSDTDRNLYVKSLALNDSDLNRSARLTQNGEASFVISRNETVSTVSLTATPSSILRGQTSILTLVTQNVTSCTGTGVTVSGTSGLLPVMPTETTTYKVTCTGGGGTVSAETTVTVSVPVVSTLFKSGDRVETTSVLNVRSIASLTGSLLGTQPLGARGAVLEASQVADGENWWKIDFDSSTVDGWSVETYLTKTTTPNIPLPTASLTANPTSIQKGQSTTLTLVSTDAATCATSGFTLVGTSGSATVSPLQSTTYKVTCANLSGVTTKEVTVAVTDAPGTSIGDPETLSPDGSSISPLSGGSVRSQHGNWTFSERSGPSGHRIALNGTLTRGASGVLLLIANGGRVYAQNTNGKWFTYSGSRWNSSSGPTSTPPVPVDEEELPPSSNSEVLVFGAGSDTVRLALSGDIWVSPPQYDLLLDGRKIGGGSVFAENRRSQITYVDVKGDFTSAERTLVVRYYNDAWGGSSDADRNLYVKSVALNGVDQNMASTLRSNGDARFVIGNDPDEPLNEDVPQPVATSPTPSISGSGGTSLTLEPQQGGFVTDAAGNRWSFGNFDSLGHRIALNGSTSRYTGEGVLILIYNGRAYFQNNIGQWFYLTATDWGGIASDPRAQVQGIARVVNFTQLLSAGATGDEVEALQWLLTDLGHYTGAVTGHFDNATTEAVEAYQAARGLTVTGSVGPQTRALLNYDW